MHDRFGRVERVVKIAHDFTERKLRDGEFQAQVRALEPSQAMVRFALDGTVLDANENFLRLMGYVRDEVVGQHHRLFVNSHESGSPGH